MSSSLAAVLCFKCLVLFGLGFQAVKFATRSLGDVGMRLNTTPRNPNVLECVHEILARLVKGVYARDRGDPTASRYWKDIDYTEMDIDQFGGPDSQARKLKVSGSRGQSKPDEPIRVMVFKRCGSDNRKYLLKTDDDEEEEVYVPAPKYVVAIRGTMMNWKDWRANMNILGETICGLRPLYGPVMEVIKDVHDKCSADGDVCVAGHSLGAMLALVATRLLAKEKQIVLKAHLFNPPYISVSTLTKKAFLQVPIGLEKVLGIIPVFGPSAAAAVRRGAERLYDIHEEMVTAAAEEFLREKWDSAVASNQLTDVQNLVTEFLKLICTPTTGELGRSRLTNSINGFRIPQLDSLLNLKEAELGKHLDSGLNNSFPYLPGETPYPQTYRNLFPRIRICIVYSAFEVQVRMKLDEILGRRFCKDVFRAYL
ncbi:hypothetical protein R1sor_012488 [Riccia sorocarpa]|uniref:Fungal lipase-like domain-containing protein n=1 Tax=Riccia sorocarpa TaxID=122646 RepID=A0ABD3I7Y5_9MARC